MLSPPFAPYPPISWDTTDPRTRPNHPQLNIQIMPENSTGYYPESGSRQFELSNSQALVSTSPTSPLEMLNEASIMQNCGPYSSLVQTRLIQSDPWAPYNVNQQAAALFECPATIPVGFVVDAYLYSIHSSCPP